MISGDQDNALMGASPTKQNGGTTKELNHCDKVAVGGKVMSTGNAMPVREDLLESLSYLISLKVANNEYEDYRQAAREEYIGSSVCPSSVQLDMNSDASIDIFALAG